MKSREKKPKIEKGDFIAFKNYTRLHVLTLLPNFKNELRKARNELGIPPNGFDSDEKTIDWLNKNNYGFHGVLPAGFYKEERRNPFKEKVFEIGNNFNLPFHFFYSSAMGLAWYILTNKFAVSERNWEINTPLLKQDGKAKWVALSIFMQLTGEERKEAIKELTEEQKRLMKPNVIQPHRPKQQFERDLEILEFMSGREPHADDRLLLREIAEEFGISESAASHALERLDDLSVSFFGKPLRKKRDDTKLNT